MRRPQTLGAVADGIIALRSALNPTEHAFVWDALSLFAEDIHRLAPAIENEALEHAAIALEAKITPETGDEELSYDGAMTEAASIVRALKHYEK